MAATILGVNRILMSLMLTSNLIYILHNALLIVVYLIVFVFFIVNMTYQLLVYFMLSCILGQIMVFF